MEKKVSIIVPVYNVEKYLDKCLDSLVNQSLQEIEIIVVNDGSPDNSQKIIDEYVKKYPNKIKAFIKENGGLSSARNFGIDKISKETKYISFVDSDDWLDLNAIEEMYEKAKKDNSDIVICDIIDHYPDKEVYHNCTIFNNPFEVTPSACNKLFKKDIINNIRFVDKIWYEDLNFTTKLLLNKPKISVISKGFYNCHSGHISIMNNNNILKNLDMIYVIDDIIKYAREKDVYDKNIISFLIFHHILITSINRVAIQNGSIKKNVIKKYVEYCKKNIGDYRKMKFYKNISFNRKIVAYLNYHNLWWLSKIILKMKAVMK